MDNFYSDVKNMFISIVANYEKFKLVFDDIDTERDPWYVYDCAWYQ